MPPGKRKDNAKSTKQKLSVTEDSWRTEIENLTLNDSGWKCAMAMIVETRADHAKYLDLFTEAADEEKRDAVFSLSYQKLIRGVKLLGRSDLRRGICHFASKKIEEEGEGAMGPWLTCRLIKYFVNRARARNIEVLRSRARIERGITQEVEVLMAARPHGTESKSKVGSGEVAKRLEKANTRLRKRGEEWRDRIHVDDAPAEGPNLYVVLSGFHDIELTDELLNTGLPLTAIFKVLRPGETPDPQQTQLRTFWSSLEAAMKDPKRAFRYSNIVFQTFCPPEIRDSDLEAQRADAYRRISFLMYDLCDIRRQHESYIRSMKLQGGLEEKRPEVLDTTTYDTVMKAFPEECTSVAMVLDALLVHIEGLNSQEEASDQRKKSSGLFDDRLRSKIDRLNEEFEVFETVKTNRTSDDPRLILHGDDFGLKTHHCSFTSCETIPKDFGVRVLRQSAISLIWKNVPILTNQRMEMHRHHIHRISNCFDAKIEDSTTEHYLHILLFDKWINDGGSCRRSDMPGRDDPDGKTQFPSLGVLGLKKANVKGTKSQTIARDKSLAESLPATSKSDGTIEYGKEIAETFECPELFGLIDTREMLRSDFIPAPEEPLPVSDPRILDLEEFDSVQILSPEVFAQVFFVCYQKFGCPETRYFPPTDSVLILFRGDRVGDDNVSKEEYSASIRTPVCLRDFSSFVMEEEKEWLDKEDEEHSRKISAEEAVAPLSLSKDQKPGGDLPLGSFYTEVEFVLPNSIKGSEARGKKSLLQGLVDGTEAAAFSRAEPTARPKKKKDTKETNQPKVKIPKRNKTRVINPSAKAEESLEANTSIPPLESTLASEDAGPRFLGYDIANHRVQVSGCTSHFTSVDGTKVKVDLEEWTYGKRRLQIGIRLLGNDLVLQKVVGDDSARFHLTTTNGILMGFSVPFIRKDGLMDSRESIHSENYHSGKMGRESETRRVTWTPEMAVDPGFRASWPSGLVVDTLPGDGPPEPFYIKQSHLLKGPECTGIEGERARVFLREGSILVFLEDRSLRLMRSNGRIVTCTFGNEKNGERERGAEGDFVPRLKSNQNSRGSIGVKTNRESLSSFYRDDRVLENADRNSKISGIHRSLVLEPDGKLYEIYDGEKTRVLGQELVRTSSDYEVGENFTRRGDGTNLLINSDGFLAVSFPDGTRITTGYVIEKDLVFCEWTDEELGRFYRTSNRNSESRQNILEEGFVSIFLTTCMEHKNYATVSYDQSKIECSLSMPGNVAVQISSECLTVIVEALTFLEVKESGIVFNGKMGASQGGSSTSVFDLGEAFDPPNQTKSFLKTTDSLGNIFSVDSDGDTSYEKFGRGLEPAGNDGETQNFRFQSDPRSYRLFAVRRDLSAYEYLHNSNGRDQEENPATSTFFRKLLGQPNQILCATLTPPSPITVSQAWLQPYKVKSIRPTNEDRRDLVRSTYSVPWNYLIPYGKNGVGIRERTWNLALKSHGNFSGPKVLVARTTLTFKNREERLLKRLQLALGCYWKKSLNSFHEYGGLESRRCSSRPEEKGETLDWLNENFALGGKKTFPKALYFDGLVQNRAAKRSPEFRVSKRRTSGSKDEAARAYREEIEWYKTCLRDQIIPPYFVNVPGACFTWVLECVDKAIEASRGKETGTND